MEKTQTWDLIYKQLELIENEHAAPPEVYAACLFVVAYLAVRAGQPKDELIQMLGDRYDMILDAQDLEHYIHHTQGEA